jgi:hypothetical protein
MARVMGAALEPQLCRVLQEHCNSSYVNPPSSSHNSLAKTPGKKAVGSRAVPMNRADLEPSGFSPDDS